MSRFDPEALRDIAGQAVFERGAEYHEDNKVELLEVGATRVSARVLGSEIYRTSLSGGGAEFSGECTCPAFSDRGFCKHLVATALTANALDPKGVEIVNNRFTQIRDHLRSLGSDKLTAMIMQLAERDERLLEDLELAVAASTADDEALFKRFKRAITQATVTHGYIEYREARAWADEIRNLLDRMASLIDAGRATLVLRLLDYFFSRMDQALSSMDDSDGQGGAVYARGCEIHLAACQKSKLDPVTLARDLFSRELESDWDFFQAASETYADVLGESGLKEYRRLAEKAWQKIEPKWQSKQRVIDDSSDRYRLAAILESFAEREGNLDARIAIRAKDLSSAYSYLGIAQLYLEHGRDSEALKWTEDGLWQFDDRPAEGLVLFADELYRRLNRPDDADKLLWKTFERCPSVELYRRLKTTARTDRGHAGIVRERAFATLRGQLGTSKQAGELRWSSPAEILVTIMLEEGLLGEAWEVVRGHGCTEPLLESLAKASEESHPSEVLNVYAQRIDRLIAIGGNGNYANACGLIARMGAIRRRINQDAAHATYVAELMKRHKAKRNFMKLIQEQS